MPQRKRPSRSARKGVLTPRAGEARRRFFVDSSWAEERPAPARPSSATPPAPIAGVVVRNAKHLEIEPLFQKGPSLLLSRDGVRPQPGDLVLYSYSHGRRARVLQIIGKKGVLPDVMDALLYDNLVRRGFHDEVLAEAEEAARLEHRHDHYRADLTDLFTFTVDPATARDFDDALSFEEADGLVIVYVHIADVSYYVAEETMLDQEALRRGTSVYVPTGVEPMLPPVLSSGVCSLLVGAARKTVTVEMKVDPADARVRRVHFYRSLIRSSLQMDYDELQAVFDGKITCRPDLECVLSLARPLARRLRQNRFDRGSLRLTSVEPDFHWDTEGRIVGAHPAEELESHQFIEEYMILANEQVAAFLEREQFPTVYRVHDSPDPLQLSHLLDILTALDVPTPVFDPMRATPKDVRRVTRETAEWVDRFTPKGKAKLALSLQILKAQARAVYQTDNIGHFGLASLAYCHFTSPIRRYPDLLVHRSLLAKLDLGPLTTTSTLSEWAEHCSRMEREAAKVELTADDIALAHLLKSRLDRDGWDRTYGGQIVGLVGTGAFVLFDELYQGFLAAKNIPGDYFELNELETALIGRRTGEAYRLADIVPIKVLAVDEARGKIDVVLAALE